jgi:hypothetical protein
LPDVLVRLRGGVASVDGVIPEGHFRRGAVACGAMANRQDRNETP